MLHHFNLHFFTLINKSGSNFARVLLETLGFLFNEVFVISNPVLNEDNNCVCIQPDKLFLVFIS